MLSRSDNNLKHIRRILSMFSLQSKRKNKLKVAHMIQGWNENNNDYFYIKMDMCQIISFLDMKVKKTDYNQMKSSK